MQIGFWYEKNICFGLKSTLHFEMDAFDRSDFAVGSEDARGGDCSPLSEVAFCELIVNFKGKDKATRCTDRCAVLESDLEWELCFTLNRFESDA